MRLMPWMNDENRKSGSEVVRMSGSQVNSSSNITPISRRARLAPRQKCGPPAPKPTCSFGVRRTSKVNGSSKMRSSRLADSYHMTTLSPSVIGTPAISVSAVAVRRKCTTGDAQRTISSVAVGMTPARSAARIARWSSLRVSCSSPWLIALRVVSLPAAESRMKKLAISIGSSRSPSTSACIIAETRSSVGFARRSSPTAWAIWVISMTAPISVAMSGASSGSPAPRMTLVSSKMRSQESRGMPIISQMICNGSCAATSCTKSQLPRSATERTISRPLTCTSRSIAATRFGVNARLTMRRSRVWRGSSMLIIEPMNSEISTGRSGMFVPLPEQNRSGWRDTCMTSA